jgi:hypothetical protein
VTRRLHIAGSAKRDADPDLLRDAHTLAWETAYGWASNGGTLVGGLGGESMRDGHDDLSIIFDWTIAEATLAALEAGLAEPHTEEGPLLGVRTSRRALEQVPERRRATLDALLERRALDIKLLPDGWRSGALMRRAQAEIGGVLVTLSGGAGVEDLVNLYVERDRPVVPIDIDLGSANSDAAQGGGTALARKALTDARPFLRLADGNPPVPRLIQVAMGPDRPPAGEVAARLLGLLADLDPPRAFCVRLLAPDHEAFDDVDWFFGDVVKPVLEETGLRVVDLGADPQERAWMNDEIFVALHSAEMVVADLTGARPNCLLELGYALGRGHRTVVAARRGEPMPFDADKLPWLFWERAYWPDVTREALRDHLKRFGARAPLVEPTRMV